MCLLRKQTCCLLNGTHIVRVCACYLKEQVQLVLIIIGNKYSIWWLLHRTYTAGRNGARADYFWNRSVLTVADYFKERMQYMCWRYLKGQIHTLKLTEQVQSVVKLNIEGTDAHMLKLFNGPVTVHVLKSRYGAPKQLVEQNATRGTNTTRATIT
jgi:hypothetical protein